MWIWVVLILVALIVVGLWAWQRRRTDHLKERFGPEYDRTVAESDKRDAEMRLLEREKRHEELDIRPLSAQSRDRFQDEWQKVQARFVDDPEGAVRDADGLVARVMSERGYPTDGDPEARAEDLSVEHASVVGEYRRGHELLEGLDDSEEATERLRESMQCFRKAFEELLDDREVARR
jgi:FtsZ-interacting cell division protein ZipA